MVDIGPISADRCSPQYPPARSQIRLRRSRRRAAKAFQARRMR
jgi:hypothetical protein